LASPSPPPSSLYVSFLSLLLFLSETFVGMFSGLRLEGFFGNPHGGHWDLTLYTRGVRDFVSRFPGTRFPGSIQGFLEDFPDLIEAYEAAEAVGLALQDS